MKKRNELLPLFLIKYSGLALMQLFSVFKNMDNHQLALVLDYKVLEDGSFVKKGVGLCH